MNEFRDISKKTSLIALWFLLLLTILVYIRAINHHFINWDDGRLVYENYFVRNFSTQGISVFFNIKKYFSQADPVPLTYFSHALTWYFFPNKPSVFIFINILIHLLNVVLVYKFVHLLFRNFAFALIATAFFAVHPFRVESVVWISERKDVLYTLFFLSGLIVYIQYLNTKKNKYLIFVFMLFICSVLSKQAAIIFPLILLLIDYSKERKDYKQLWKEKIFFFLFSALVIFTMSFIHQYHQIYDISVSRFSPFDRIFFVCYSILYYIFQYFVPHNLNAIHYFPDKVNGWLPIIYYLTPFFIISIIGSFVYIYKRHILIQKSWIFGFLFFFINILLVINITPLSPFAIVAERYTYMAHIGLGIFSATFFLYFFRNYFKLKLVFIICILLIFSFRTYSRTAVWRSTFTLFTDSMKKNPTKVIPYIKRGLVYVADNQNDKALIEFETAVKIRPGSTSAHYQRGKILYKCGNYKDAIVDFNFCIKRNMFLPEMYRYRGLTRMKQNQPINALNDWFSAYCNKDTDSKILIKEYIKKLNLKEKLDYKNEPGLKR